MTADTLVGPRIGVVIVMFNSADLIDECLESLFAAGHPGMRVVVVDNNSGDHSCDVVCNWASGDVAYRQRAQSPLPPTETVPKPIPMADVGVDQPFPPKLPLILLRSSVNGGYAYAVNHGLRLLLTDADIDMFWVLNPDCVVPATTPTAIALACADPDFSLMGGRAIYYERPGEIQTDGGQVSRLTGICRSMNCGQNPASTPLPDAASVDYITGASMVASRTFIDAAGLMDDAYFLYYEEVDWAFRRGSLPLRIVPDMLVYHRGGTTIGTGDTTRRASAFANYFNYRNRIWFVRRFLPAAWLFTVGFAMAKALQLVLKGGADEAGAVLAGTFGRTPPDAVRSRIVGPDAQALAFATKRKPGQKAP
jgi:GT2 family glycosyltransferase